MAKSDEKMKVCFSNLSTPLKTLVVLGWIVVGINIFLCLMWIALFTILASVATTA